MFQTNSNAALPSWDLTSRFCALRQEVQVLRGKPGGGGALSRDVDSGRGNSIEMIECRTSLIDNPLSVNEPLPRWYEGLLEVKDIVKNVSNQVDQIDNLHLRRRMRVFKDRNMTAMETDIRMMTTKILSDLKNANEIINHIKTERGARPNTSENRIQNAVMDNAIKAASKRVAEVTEVHYNIQDKYAKLHDMRDDTPSSNDLGIDEDVTSHVVGGVSADLQMMASVGNKVKERQIGQMVQNVEAVHQLFNDVADVVVEQGTMLDRIDYNIENVANNVEMGHGQLLISETKHKNRLSKRVIWGLAAWNMGCMLVIAFKMFLRLKK